LRKRGLRKEARSGKMDNQIRVHRKQDVGEKSAVDHHPCSVLAVTSWSKSMSVKVRV